MNNSIQFGGTFLLGTMKALMPNICIDYSLLCICTEANRPLQRTESQTDSNYSEGCLWGWQGELRQSTMWRLMSYTTHIWHQTSQGASGRIAMVDRPWPSTALLKCKAMGRWRGDQGMEASALPSDFRPLPQSKRLLVQELPHAHTQLPSSYFHSLHRPIVLIWVSLEDGAKSNLVWHPTGW